MKSPKAKYRLEINFNKPVAGLGSVVSFNSESTQELRTWAGLQVEKTGVDAWITIHENLSVYPSFNWVKIDDYAVDETGKLDIKKTISTKLKAARLNAGKSQVDIAKDTGWMQGFVQRLETGKTAPTIATITKYLEACGQYRIDIKEL